MVAEAASSSNLYVLVCTSLQAHRNLQQPAILPLRLPPSAVPVGNPCSEGGGIGCICTNQAPYTTADKPVCACPPGA